MSDYDDGATPPSASSGFLSYLPVILRQRKWLVIVPAVLSSLIGVIVAFAITPVYRASATLLVEAQQLPTGLVGASNGVLIDKRIATIRQQVLSRPDVISLVRKYNLYGAGGSDAQSSAMLDTVRGATTIAPVASEFARSEGSSNTIAFQLTFDYPNPATATVVTREFVDRLLKLDATQTAEQAAGTVSFLEEEAKGLATQISAIEGQIEAIKSRNGTTLSSAGALMASGGAGYGAEIASLTRENNQLRSQLSTLSNASQADPIVAAAEAQLATARAVYSDNHPDVRLAELKLAQARRMAGRNTAAAVNLTTITNQIAANESMISALNAQKAREDSRASSAVAAQSRVPLVTEQIAQLDAKANQLRLNYQTVANNLMNARATMRMDQEKKGERLSVIDQPQASETPLKPKRPLIIAGGVLAGLVLGLVLALLVEFVRRPIRGVGGAEKVTGSVPLVVVPTLGRTSHAVRRKSLFNFWGLGQPARS